MLTVCCEYEEGYVYEEVVVVKEGFTSPKTVAADTVAYVNRVSWQVTYERTSVRCAPMM